MNEQGFLRRYSSVIFAGTAIVPLLLAALLIGGSADGVSGYQDGFTDSPASTVRLFDRGQGFPISNVEWSRSISAAANTRIMLPALDSNTCETAVHVQNVGGDAAKAMLLLWGEAGSCEPAAAGPLAVLCSGLIPAGSGWTFPGSDIPPAARSGIIYPLNTDTYSNPVLGTFGSFADLVCDHVATTVLGDEDEWHLMDSSYSSGGTWEGFDFGGFQGQPLAAVVERTCPGDKTSSMDVSAAYTGVTEEMLGMSDPVSADHVYHAPLVLASYGTAPDDMSSILHIQNTGDECTSAEIWYQSQDDCDQAISANILAIAPGEAVQVDPNEAVGPGFRGSAWIRASVPLAVVVDQVGRDQFMSYNAVPADVVDPNTQEILYSAGSVVNYVPLTYREYTGWDTEIHVQNLSSVDDAKVKVSFLDASGNIVQTIVEWICPRGSRSFLLSRTNNRPGNYVGAVRVESQEYWLPPPDDIGVVPSISTVVNLINEETGEAVSYNALPEQHAFDWQLGEEPGVGLITIPGVNKTTDLGIQNLNPKPGWTSLRLDFFDSSDRIFSYCQTLNEKQTELVDLSKVGPLPSDWEGSVVISGTTTTQAGGFGLGAVAIMESDSVGDRLAAVEGGPGLSYVPEALPECNPASVPYAPPDKAPLTSTAVYLPAIDTANGWDSWIQVQNVGDDPTKAILLVWGEASPCTPQSAGPLATECTGLIRPGGIWTWTGRILPAGARSAIVYSLSAEPFINPSNGEPDVFADAVCDQVLQTVIGDADEWRRFHQAFQERTLWDALNFCPFSGQPLAVHVRRVQASEIEGASVVGSYAGISAELAGAYDPSQDGFSYYAPISVGSNGFSSELIIQNAGDECTSVEIRYLDEEACSQAETQRGVALSPGESVRLDPGEVLTAPWRGTAWIESSEPLAVVVDRWTTDRLALSSYQGMPAYYYDAETEAQVSTGALFNYAPLIYREFNGWDTEVQVQNLSSTDKAKVKVYFLDNSGHIIDTAVEWICPRGARRFTLPANDTWSGLYVGAARIESQVWWDPSTPPLEIPYVQGVVHLVNEQRGEMLSYNAIPAQQAGGTNKVTIPFAASGRGGVTTDLVIHNTNPNPGYTRIQLNIYDQNGLVDIWEPVLGLQPVEYVQLDATDRINPGFLGSIEIEAVESIQEGGPSFVALAVQRSGTNPDATLMSSAEGILVASDEGSDTPDCPPVLWVSPTALDLQATFGGPNPVAQQINVYNIGTGSLDWSATKDAPWITIAPISGIIPITATLAVSVETASLAAGPYTGTITITSTTAGVLNSPQTVTVTLNVGLLGDFDGDCQVTAGDIMQMANRWRQAAGLPYDFDGDGIATIVDIQLVATQWGQTCGTAWDLKQLHAIGVTILGQRDDSAPVLANEDQLEALARLRFEPQSMDELGMLVAAHAQAKAWLAAGMGSLLEGEQDWPELADQTGGMLLSAAVADRAEQPEPGPVAVYEGVPLFGSYDPASRPICTSLVGDFDADGDVDGADIWSVANRWRQAAGALYNFDDDVIVTIVDVMRETVRWGERLP